MPSPPPGNLSKQGTKEDKIKRITCHYLRGNRVTINNKNNRSTSLSGRNSSTESDSNSENEDSDGETSDEGDEVLKVIIDEQDVDSDDSDNSQSEESNLVDDKAWFPLSQLRPRQRPISSQNKAISVKDHCSTL